MKAVFLFFKKVGLGLCLAAIALCCAFSASVSFATERQFIRGFHFVVIVTDKMQAAAGWNALDGGAGYVMQSGEGVAIGVYFSLSDAQSVQKKACEYYPRVEVETRRVERLRFLDRTEKRNADKLVAAYATLYEYFRLLFQESVRLLEGGTQESSKRILRSAGEQLVFLGESNAAVDEGFASVCKLAGEDLQTICKESVLVKDLRYFLCKYAEEYLSLIGRYEL